VVLVLVVGREGEKYKPMQREHCKSPLGMQVESLQLHQSSARVSRHQVIEAVYFLRWEHTGPSVYEMHQRRARCQ
jgi:hypothetical protein